MKPTALILITVVALVGCETVSPQIYLTAKSDAGYQVRLRGDLDQNPRGMFRENIVLFELVSPTATSPQELHRSDHLDSPLRGEYPSEKWIQPNILRFESYFGKGLPLRTVNVRNSTGRSIAALKIQAGDLFLAFDVPRNGHLFFQAPASIFLAVSGQFADGAPIPKQTLQRNRAGHAAILIAINEPAGVTFEFH